ncbi:MAG: hypothetical protein KF734_02585 [Saprospiraceae bacterium]|nr:hypothetical protein [Saprospiraceae bacterium]
MKYFLLFFSALAFLLTCKKENDYSWQIKALNDCIASSAANSPKSPGAEYAQFKLNGRKILFSDGYDGYQQFNDIALTFTTSGSVLNLGDSSKQYLLKIGFDQPNINTNNEPIFKIYSPSSDQVYIALQKKESLTVVEFIDKYIQVGDLKLKQKHTWESSDPDLTDGFEINYWCVCDCKEIIPEGVTLAFQSTNTEQAGYLRCTKLDRVDLGETVTYHIEFEMACDLYLGGTGTYIGKLEEGKMAVDFVVEK